MQLVDMYVCRIRVSKTRSGNPYSTPAQIHGPLPRQLSFAGRWVILFTVVPLRHRVFKVSEKFADRQTTGMYLDLGIEVAR